jgi:hypothetical protein
MKIARKVAVALDLSEPLPEVYKSLKYFEFLKNTDLHFVFSYMTTSYAVGIGDTSIIYPMEDDRAKIQESAVAMMKDLATNLLPKDFFSRVSAHCLFSDDPKRKFCSFLEDQNIDMVIVAARAKKGIFDSSFTNYVSKHSLCNMLVLKHNI